MNSTNNILVIIVTYNAMRWIQRCLDSVVGSTIPMEIMVIDNGSSDDTCNYISANYPSVNLVINENNEGFGAANNIGIKYAIENSFDYIYLLNQDAWLSPNAIELMVASHKQAPQYGILSPLQMYPDETTMERSFARYVKLSTSRNNDLSKEIFEIKFVMAAHWLISKECFSKVGYFSPIFYHYGEDNNYIHRVKHFKFKVGVVPQAIAVHDRESRTLTVDHQIYMVRNSYLKHSSNVNFGFIASIIFGNYIVLRDAHRLSRRLNDKSLFLKTIKFDRNVSDIYHDRQKNKRPL